MVWYKNFISLTRLNKPIGILLLLWPTLWALWLASSGHPDNLILFVFMAGVIVMRSAGCIINDLADRHVDGLVKRTSERVLASGKMSVRAALLLFFALLAIAFCLVLFCNFFTIQLAFIGAALAVIYPFLKRVTNLPQFGLGLAFTWGVPMAFAAVTNEVSPAAWFLFLTGMIWPVMYDTMYAMVDRDDDVKIGVKSTAILFGQWDKAIITGLQMVFLAMLVLVGQLFQLQKIYYISLFISSLFFIYQQYLIKDRERMACFRAFLNNNWVGLIIFLGIMLSS
jgi:4-hydroxybenzoate polyprenyltransferase